MKCPACSSQLSELKAGDITVDICRPGCGGVWFDSGEIKKFDEPHEVDGKDLFSTQKKAGLQRNEPPLGCPRCEGEVLGRQSYDPKSQVEIDLCWNCGGIWLDPGELATIRSQFKTEAERQKASDDFLQTALDQHIDVMKLDAAQELRDAEETSRRYRASLRVISWLLWGTSPSRKLRG